MICSKTKRIVPEKIFWTSKILVDSKSWKHKKAQRLLPIFVSVGWPRPIGCEMGSKKSVQELSSWFWVVTVWLGWLLWAEAAVITQFKELLFDTGQRYIEGFIFSLIYIFFYDSTMKLCFFGKEIRIILAGLGSHMLIFLAISMWTRGQINVNNIINRQRMSNRNQGKRTKDGPWNNAMLSQCPKEDWSISTCTGDVSLRHLNPSEMHVRWAKI